MIWAFRQLLVPCNYLRIKQGDGLFTSKAVYDFVLPAFLTGITLAVPILLGTPVSLAGHTLITKSLSDLLALLIAFYMAALAAVSTFERKGIDDALRGGDATLKVLHHETNTWQKKKLSYRQYIAYLFGYLAFLSLMLFMALIFIRSAWPKIVTISQYQDGWGKFVQWVADPLLFVLFFFGVWQLFVTSLLGIYFLSDRFQSLNDPHH